MSEAAESGDWRRTGQERYLMGAEFKLLLFTQHSQSWDHDHCEFCWEKFSEAPEDLNNGYVTIDGYRWVCSGCFKDFKEEFKWVLRES